MSVSLISSTTPIRFLGSARPRSTLGTGTVTLSPTLTVVIIRLLRLTIRSACCCWASFARFLEIWIACWLEAISAEVVSVELVSDNMCTSLDDSLVVGNLSPGTEEGWLVVVVISLGSCSEISLGDETGAELSLFGVVSWHTLARRSSSLCSLLNTSCGKLDDVRPILASAPSNAANGEHLIPLWWLAFFWNCTNFSPIVQSVVSLSPNHATNMSFMSQLALSTDPWLWGCLGFPWTSTRSGHNSFSSTIIWAVNSEPLSLCKIHGAPSNRKISSNWYATSAARLDVSGRSTQNFVRWSWYTIIHLNSPCFIDCMSIRSTCPLELKSLLTIGLTTDPLVVGLLCFRWHSTHKDLNNDSDSWVTLAYFLFTSFTILSLPPWPVNKCTLFITSKVSSIVTK